MAGKVHSVRLEPLGVDIDIVEGETVLNAALRQGIALMHGCKEGQCGSCKSRLLNGDVQLLKYSTFALPDHEREAQHVLLCRALADSDIAVELLSYDDDLMRHPFRERDFAR